jgi:hypothetical protein
MPTDIPWDSVLNIAYLLIIFVAPAILNRLKGKGDETLAEQRDKALEEIKKRIEPRRRIHRHPDEETYGGHDEIEHPSIEEPSATVQTPHYRAAVEDKTPTPRRVHRSLSAEPEVATPLAWLDQLPEAPLKRAFVLKTLFDKPIALDTKPLGER